MLHLNIFSKERKNIVKIIYYQSTNVKFLNAVLIVILSIQFLNCSSEKYAPSSEKSISHFNFLKINNSILNEDIYGIIDQDKKVIEISIPENFIKGNLTDLIASFGISENTKVFVDKEIQNSGITSNDFSESLEYEVVAENGKKNTYTVTVTIILRSGKSMLNFDFLTDYNLNLDQNIYGIINEEISRIDLDFSDIPNFSDYSNLVASFKTSEGSKVYVNNEEQFSDESILNFSSLVEYIVKAENGSQSKYEVLIKKEKNFENSINSFQILKSTNPNISRTIVGSINYSDNIIIFHNPHFNENILIPSFELPDGASIRQNGNIVLSGVTPLDFSRAISLTVTAENGDEAIWTLESTREIVDLEDFLSVCPLEDPNIGEILNDFQFRINGEVINDFPCAEPYYLMEKPSENYSPTEYYTETTGLQSLRFLYYLDYDHPQVLPWSELRLYDWLVSKIDGIDIIDGLNVTGRCCFTDNGKLFIQVKNKRTDTSPSVFNWSDGLYYGFKLMNISLILHEARHVDGFHHVYGCCESSSCDEELDLNNPSAFGIMVWWHQSHWEGKYDFNVECVVDHDPLFYDLQSLFNPNIWSNSFCSGPFNYEFPDDAFNVCEFE